MNERLFFTTSLATPIKPMEELTTVALRRPISVSEGDLPKGAVGAVVSVYGSGEAYCVEFVSPLAALAIVDCVDLEVVGDVDGAPLYPSS